VGEQAFEVLVAAPDVGEEAVPVDTVSSTFLSSFILKETECHAHR
jgi:hypothetical protein